LEKKKSL